MNRKTKYFFLIKNLIIVFVFILVISTLKKIMNLYQDISPEVFETIRIVFTLFNTLLIISFILGILYLVYQLFLYIQSHFYKTFHINAFEALYHGILDMHQVYDKIYTFGIAGNINVDFQKNILYLSTEKKHYSFIFLDLFGKVEGSESNDFWYLVRSPKTKYGKSVYTNRIRFPNPMQMNQEFIDDLASKTGNKYKNYIVISGFYQMKTSVENVITPYEIISLISKDKTK